MKMKEYFIIEQNKLNNEWMVFSNDERLVQCWHFSSKKQAIECAHHYNLLANKQENQ